MERLQSNQFIIRNIHSPSGAGAQGAVCIRCLQEKKKKEGILMRNQFVSVSHGEVCTVMWPRAVISFFLFKFYALSSLYCRKIAFKYPVIHKRYRVNDMKKRTGEKLSLVVCFCPQLNNLFVSQSTVRSKGVHDQNIVINL